MSTFWMIWALLIVVFGAFNVAAMIVSSRKNREQARMLLEVHGMLVRLTEEDAELRYAIFERVTAADRSEGEQL